MNETLERKLITRKVHSFVDRVTHFSGEVGCTNEATHSNRMECISGQNSHRDVLTKLNMNLKTHPFLFSHRNCIFKGQNNPDLEAPWFKPMYAEGNSKTDKSTH
jgi:hypothetical protein